MTIDPYKILKVNQNAKLKEIKKAYIKLVKIHHPDKGGDTKVMLEINRAWEMLKKKHKDLTMNYSTIEYSHEKHSRNEYKQKTTTKSESLDIQNWFQNIYLPIDKLLGQIINPLALKIKELSADPYDELLMDSFCMYLEKSKYKIARLFD